MLAATTQAMNIVQLVYLMADENPSMLRWNDLDDLTLRSLVHESDSRVADGAQAELDRRVELAGGSPKLEQMHEEEPDL